MVSPVINLRTPTIGHNLVMDYRECAMPRTYNLLRFPAFLLTIAFFCPAAYSKAACDFSPAPLATPGVDATDLETRMADMGTLFKTAQGHFQNKEYTRAIEFYEKCLARNPDHACANNGLAWLLLTCEDLKYRDHQRALKLAKKAVTGDRSCGACWDTLGVARLRSGNLKAAHRCFLKAMSLQTRPDKEALKNYLDYISSHEPEVLKEIRTAKNRKYSYTGLLTRGNRFLFKSKNPLAAIDCYTLAILGLHNHPLNYLVHYRRAEAWFATDEIELALIDTMKSINLEKKFGPAHNLQGYLYWSTGMQTAALKSYTRAVAINPQNSLFRFNRAMVLYKQAQYESAREDLTAAINANPAKKEAYCLRAEIFIRLKNYQAAEADALKALELDPAYSSASLILTDIRQKIATRKVSIRQHPEN